MSTDKARVILVRKLKEDDGLRDSSLSLVL